jgi:Domain of unknown function (DUF4166)
MHRARRDLGAQLRRPHLPVEAQRFAARGLLSRRLHPFTYELELLVRNGSLHLLVRCGWLFGLPLPAFLLPVSEAREYDTDGVFHFDVALRAPLGGGLIVGYEGWLAPDTKRRAARDASSAPVS